MAPPQVAWTGLSVLFIPPDADAVADIVFVHGLQGHPQRTWTCTKPASIVPGGPHGSSSEFMNVKKKRAFHPRSIFTKLRAHNGHGSPIGTSKSDYVYWPKDLLPTDCPKARIMAWGYDTVITRGMFIPTNQGSIFSHARDLLYGLHRERPLDRPLIFVAHSLGGIVVKEMLRRSQSSDESEIQNIVQCTRGVVFLGTPHRGSPEMAAFGDVVRKVASVTLMADSNPKILRALGLDSPELELCRESFTSQWRKYGFQVKTFQEGLGMTGLHLGRLNQKVVSDISSSFDDALEHAETIQANHMDMTRFPSSDDPGYRKVGRELRRLVRAISAAEPLRNYLDDSNARTLLSSHEYRQGIHLPSHIRPSSSDSPLSESNLREIPHLESSLEWFLKDPEYLRWSGGTPWSFLWLHGGPGAGKTVIMSYLLHELPKKFGYADNWDIAAAFCHPGDTELGLVASLVFQLLENRVQDMQKALPLSELVQDPSIEVRQMWMLLDAAISECSNQNTLFLIDGVDALENDDRASFLKNLDYFGNRINLFASATAKVRVLISSRSYADLIDIFGELPNIEPGKERRELLKSLFFNEWNARECCVASAANAGEWLASNPHFTSWTQSETSHVLWIEGKPGSGKSTVMKKIWNKLEEDAIHAPTESVDETISGTRQSQRPETDRSTICSRFFYSSRGGTRERDHRSMLQSLLYQILTQNTYLFPLVRRSYLEVKSRHPSEIQPNWTYEDLKSALQSLQDVGFPVKIIILIDGFDESDLKFRDDALSVLTGLVSRRSFCTVKILISSRPGNDLQLILGGFHHIILQEENAGDIRILVDTKIEEVRRICESLGNATKPQDQIISGQADSPDIFAMIKHYIIEASWGVILWVTLVLDDMERCVRRGGYSQADLEQRVRSLPRELGGPNGFYRKILESLMERFSWEGGREQDIERGRRIFSWATFPKRPITTLELNDALAIPADLANPSCHKINKFRLQDLARGIVSNCGGLVETREGSDIHPIVQLMHHTVKDFLLDGTRLAMPYDLNKVQGNMEIILTCSRYIAVAFVAPVTQAVADETCSDAENIVKHLSEHHLLEYAVANLTNHPEYREGNAATSLHDDFRKFIVELQRNGTCYSSLLLGIWVESLNWPTKLSVGNTKKAQNCLQFCLIAAAARGMTRVVRLLFALGAKMNVVVSRHENPLQAAACQSNAETVRALLVAGADVNLSGGHYGSALQAASAISNVEIVSLLLDAGATVNARGGRYGNALQAASTTDKSETVQLLLDAGADVNAVTDNRNTALHEASAKGHTRVADILINKRANINIQAGSNGSALHAASKHGHEDIVRLLLANGADVNAMSDRLGTPLQAASANGNTKVANILIDGNAKVNLQGGSYGSALHAASEEGHGDIVRLLLANGADVNVMSDSHRTPFQIALAKGHRDIANLLTDNGAKAHGGSKISCPAPTSSSGSSTIGPASSASGTGRRRDRSPPPSISDGSGSGYRPLIFDTAAFDPTESLMRCYCSPRAYTNRFSLGRQEFSGKRCQRCIRMGLQDEYGWGY